MLPVFSKASEIKSRSVIIGRHLPIQSPDFLLGVVQKAAILGINTIAFCLGPPQNAYCKDLEQLKLAQFQQFLSSSNLDIKNIIVHASFMLNLANTFSPKVFQMSVDLLIKTIRLMEKIGLSTLVIHPGSCLKASKEKGMTQIVKGLNIVLASSFRVRIALETMSGRTNELGSNFEQLAYIINKVEQNMRVGVCWDSCHLFAAGYDIKNNLESVIREFEKNISLDKLWVMHVNDSKVELNSHTDRHENIGFGKIGLDALRKLVLHPKFSKIPKITETPLDKWKDEEGLIRREMEMLRKIYRTTKRKS